MSEPSGACLKGDKRDEESDTVLRILTGQTASGKSAVAADLAASGDVELISVDSMAI